MFYSHTTGGFYSAEIHGSAMPEDVVAITQGEHSALLSGLSQGDVIACNSNTDWKPILVAPEVDVSPERIERDIAAARYQAETAGITLNGMHLPTDRDSQALVTGAALAAVLDPNYHCQWKTAEGFVDLEASQIIAIATAMRTHVQACFDREAQLLAALKLGNYSPDQLAENWPV